MITLNIHLNRGERVSASRRSDVGRYDMINFPVEGLDNHVAIIASADESQTLAEALLLHNAVHMPEALPFDAGLKTEDIFLWVNDFLTYWKDSGLPIMEVWPTWKKEHTSLGEQALAMVMLALAECLIFGVESARDTVSLTLSRAASL